MSQASIFVTELRQRPVTAGLVLAMTILWLILWRWKIDVQRIAFQYQSDALSLGQDREVERTSRKFKFSAIPPFADALSKSILILLFFFVHPKCHKRIFWKEKTKKIKIKKI